MIDVPLVFYFPISSSLITEFLSSPFNHSFHTHFIWLAAAQPTRMTQHTNSTWLPCRWCVLTPFRFPLVKATSSLATIDGPPFFKRVQSSWHSPPLWNWLAPKPVKLGNGAVRCGNLPTLPCLQAALSTAPTHEGSSIYLVWPLSVEAPALVHGLAAAQNSAVGVSWQPHVRSNNSLQLRYMNHRMNETSRRELQFVCHFTYSLQNFIRPIVSKR